jgi:hypothetical protein
MGGGGEGDLEMGVKEEMVVVAKGKLAAKEQIAKEKREAQGARCQERRNAAPPHPRGKSPPHLVTPEAS